MFGSVIRPEVVVLVDHLLASIVCKQAYFPTEKNFALGLNNTPDELAKLWFRSFSEMSTGGTIPRMSVNCDWQGWNQTDELVLKLNIIIPPLPLYLFRLSIGWTFRAVEIVLILLHKEKLPVVELCCRQSKLTDQLLQLFRCNPCNLSSGIVKLFESWPANTSNRHCVPTQLNTSDISDRLGFRKSLDLHYNLYVFTFQ